MQNLKLVLQDSEIIDAIKQLCEQSHATALSKGWWSERHELVRAAQTFGGESLKSYAEATVKSGLIALIHSEASEVLEGIRNKITSDDKIPEFTAEEAELVDILVRVFDMAAAFNLRLGEALIAKMAMNKGRSHKHGDKVL